MKDGLNEFGRMFIFNKIYCMKKILFLVILSFGLATFSFAQTSTYILVRHAEKDTSLKIADPSLSKEGEQRTFNLIQALKDYAFDGIFSTNYIRTKSTATPLAKKNNKEIQVYDPKNLKAFAEQLLEQKGKTILIVGHSNTTPALTNFLLKEDKFKSLDESVYNKIFVVTVNGSKAEVKILEY